MSNEDIARLLEAIKDWNGIARDEFVSQIDDAVKSLRRPIKSKHTHVLKFAAAANAVVCIYCDFRISEMNVLRVLALATESGLTQRALDVAYCDCEIKTTYINRICQTCGKPHALRQ